MIGRLAVERTDYEDRRTKTAATHCFARVYEYETCEGRGAFAPSNPGHPEQGMGECADRDAPADRPCLATTGCEYAGPGPSCQLQGSCRRGTFAPGFRGAWGPLDGVAVD